MFFQFLGTFFGEVLLEFLDSVADLSSHSLNDFLFVLGVHILDFSCEVFLKSLNQ